MLCVATRFGNINDFNVTECRCKELWMPCRTLIVWELYGNIILPGGADGTGGEEGETVVNSGGSLSVVNNSMWAVGYYNNTPISLSP